MQPQSQSQSALQLRKETIPEMVRAKKNAARPTIIANIVVPLIRVREKTTAAVISVPKIPVSKVP